MLGDGSSLNLHKARFSRPVQLSEPTLKIKQADSLATAELRAGQPAFLIQSDNSRLLLCAETPPRSHGTFILNFHARDYPKSRCPRLVGLAYADTPKAKLPCARTVPSPAASKPLVSQ